MPMPKELFDVVGFFGVFSTLDLRSSYHQLPWFLDDHVKIEFWKIDEDSKDQLDLLLEISSIWPKKCTR